MVISTTRLEQRDGRVDRHGQKSREMLIYRFAGNGYIERERGMAETDQAIL